MRTINDVLENADITALSQGEFHVVALKRYRYAPQLEECCRLAVEELGGQPYRGPMSHAQVMGRAMELLREVHGLNVPGGWLPALRALRERAAEDVARSELPIVPESASSRPSLIAVAKQEPKIGPTLQ